MQGSGSVNMPIRGVFQRPNNGGVRVPQGPYWPHSLAIITSAKENGLVEDGQKGPTFVKKNEEGDVAISLFFHSFSL